MRWVGAWLLHRGSAAWLSRWAGVVVSVWNFPVLMGAARAGTAACFAGVPEAYGLSAMRLAVPPAMASTMVSAAKRGQRTSVSTP